MADTVLWYTDNSVLLEETGIKEWHNTESQPHSRLSQFFPSSHPHTLDYRPSPIPIHFTTIPTAYPSLLPNALYNEMY